MATAAGVTAGSATAAASAGGAGKPKWLEKKDEIDTIGGFIFFLIGRIPGRGEVVNYNKELEFTIIEADTRRIKKILVTLKK